jgi:hypothetical protein
MGALLSIPLLTGGVGAIGSSLFSGCLLFMGEWPATDFIDADITSGGSAASAFCKSCNCNSSIATRVGFGVSILQRPTSCADIHSSSLPCHPCWHISHGRTSLSGRLRSSAGTGSRWTARAENAMVCLLYVPCCSGSAKTDVPGPPLLLCPGAIPSPLIRLSCGSQIDQDQARCHPERVGSLLSD